MSFIRRNFNWIFAIILYGIFMANIFYQNHKEELLENSKKVTGILISEEHSSQKFINGRFTYFVNKKKYSLRYTGDFSYMNIGDSVLIEYAIKDPSVARVVDRYYMKKYRYLKSK